LQEGMVKMPLEKDKRMQQQQNVAVADTAVPQLCYKTLQLSKL